MTGIDYEAPVSVALGYRCPMCPNHPDDLYFNWPLFESPICDGCSMELDYFMRLDERPNDHLIDKVEEVTGLPWMECRLILLKAWLDYRERVQQERPEAWIAA